MKYLVSLLLILFALTTLSFSQEQKVNKVDGNSIDGIITAMYDVISGPAGQRNWERFSFLFKEEAMMGAISQTQDGTRQYVSMTPEQYIERNDEYFKKNDFWEEELGRKVFRFGEIATVQTAYHIRAGENGEPTHRGINSVQLVYDQGRWWITGITWNSESEDTPIPDELLENN